MSWVQNQTKNERTKPNSEHRSICSLRAIASQPRHLVLPQRIRPARTPKSIPNTIHTLNSPPAHPLFAQRPLHYLTCKVSGILYLPQPTSTLPYHPRKKVVMVWKHRARAEQGRFLGEMPNGLVRVIYVFSWCVCVTTVLHAFRGDVQWLEGRLQFVFPSLRRESTTKTKQCRIPAIIPIERRYYNTPCQQRCLRPTLFIHDQENVFLYISLTSRLGRQLSSSFGSS